MHGAPVLRQQAVYPSSKPGSTEPKAKGLRVRGGQGHAERGGKVGCPQPHSLGARRGLLAACRAPSFCSKACGRAGLCLTYAAGFPGGQSGQTLASRKDGHVDFHLNSY